MLSVKPPLDACAASSVLRSPDLVARIVAHQEGLAEDIAVVQRLANAVQITTSSSERPPSASLAHIPARFAALPYLQQYPHPTIKLPHHAFFVSPDGYDRALALHLLVVEGDVALVQQWLRCDASLCTSATLELAAAASQGLILRLLFEQFPTVATPKMMDLVAMSGDLELLMWLHEAGVTCTTAAMDGAAMNGHYDVVVFLHYERTEGCTIAAATAATVHGHASIVRFLLEQRTEGIDPSLQFKAAHREHKTHSVRGETHLEAINLVAARVQLHDYAFKTIVDKGGLSALQHVYSRGYLKRMTKPLLELAVVKQDHEMLRYILDCVDHENPRPPSDDEWLPTDAPEEIYSCNVFSYRPSPLDRWEHCKVMELAALNGDLAALELLHTSRLRVGSSRAIGYAACRGHMHVLDWLHKNRHDGCDEFAMALAAGGGHLNAMRWLHEVNGLWRTHDALATAAYIGHHEIVTYLLDVPTGDTNVCTGPGSHCSVKLPLQENTLGTSSIDYVTGSAAHWAASQGHVAILELLVGRGYEVQPRTIDDAVANGHSHVARYLHEMFGHRSQHRAIWDAVVQSHVDTVAYVLTHGFWQPCACVDEHQCDLVTLFLETARCGSLHILRLVCDTFHVRLSTQLPRFVLERMLMRAASNGHLAMVEHLCDVCGSVGCTPSVYEAAVRRGHKKVTRYLRTLRPPST